MANLNDLYVGKDKFNSKIRLNSDLRSKLITGKTSLRKKVKKSFEEKKREKPKFSGQGSYSMDTILNPLEGNECDVDYGIYIQGYEEQEMSEWPTPTTVHKWIVDAVDGHTSTPPVDKNTCVRVIYKDEYHIDLPSYILKDDKAYLAHKSKGWIESDPKSFTTWFETKVKENSVQLRRVVRYLKAWKDYQNRNSKTVDISGMALTILAAENFVSSDDRDDKSILATTKDIVETLEEKFECKKPVAPYEDLFEDYSQNKKDDVVNKLKSFITSMEKALNEEDEKKASKKLIKVYGDRFPEGEEKDDSENKKNSDEFKQFDRAAVIRDDGRSA